MRKGFLFYTAKFYIAKLYILSVVKKAVNTGVSQAVPHLSTNPALSRLTSEFGWDPVHLA